MNERTSDKPYVFAIIESIEIHTPKRKFKKISTKFVYISFLKPEDFPASRKVKNI